MTNKDKVIRILSDLDKYFEDLEKFELYSIKDLNDIKIFYATSMVLYSILQRTIDLGEEIIYLKDLPLPESYKDIFEILEKEKLILTKDSKDLKDMMNFRNLITHRYYAFDEKDVFTIYNKINIIKEFENKVKEKLKKL